MAVQNNILIQKLDEFIRKYYKNLLIKGALYSLALLIGAFLTVVLLNYFGEFNTTARSIFFFSFLALTIFVLAKYIAVPLLKLNKIGDRISYTEAASIIGTHFTSVQDKLLNVLQLQNQQGLIGSNDLLLAGIDQKINELQPVPFTSAIDLKENTKYLKYVLPILFLFLSIYFIWPSIITKGTERLVNYQTYYAKEMPFQFNVLNDDLTALQSQDYELNVKITGEQIPNEVFVKVNGIEYKLEKSDNINFTYLFKNVQKNTEFNLTAAGFESDAFELKVLPKPVITQFSAQLIYPAYLNKANEQLVNSGDMQLPQGTKVVWTFNTKNTDKLSLHFTDTLINPDHVSANQFTYSRKFTNSNNYMLKATNLQVDKAIDSVSYVVNVIPDQYPLIDLEQKVDSTDTKRVYLSGSIKDDYGFSELHFVFKKYFTDSTNTSREKTEVIPISINNKQVSQNYFYYLNASTFSLQPGDKVEYYFEVFDNDGVNGVKSSKTSVLVYKAPTLDEINENASKNNAEIKKDLEESIKRAKQLQKDVNDLSKKLNDKNQMSYDEKKKLEEILNKQQQLRNKVEEVKKENQQNNQMQNEFSQQDESLMEKQQELEKLFDEIMTPEMKKLFDELQKAMNQLNKDQVQQKLEELKLTNKDLEKELDRNLELFKQLEVQQKMQNAYDKLEELKNKELDLKNETENKNQDSKNQENKNQDNKNQDNKNKSLEEKQKEISKEFDKLKEDLKELEKKNNELEEPASLPKNEEKQNEISKQMEKSAEQLNKGNKKEASKSQDDAAKKMEEMQDEMSDSMEANEQQQQEENAAALRQILENLLNLSFSQEDLMKQLNVTRIDNPQYIKIPQQQKKLKDDSQIIEDSLLALSKRVPSISSMVNREISSINNNIDKTIKALAERNTSESSMRMQSSMTSINNLALLLNESLEQMQKQMKANAKQKGKKGNCKKPGSGQGQSPSNSPSIPNMKKLQEQLNKQLEELKKSMEQGQKPGEKPGQKPGNKPGQKPGQKPGMGQGQQGSGFNIPGSSEQFAKLAAQQEAIRRQMQMLMEKLKNKGSNPGGNIAELMEQTEKELVNKQVSNEMIKRQNDILTKLLESEKAEREREQDEKRKSNEAKNQNLSNPSEFLEYKRLKEKELELINTVPPSLTPFYKEKVNNYFNSVNKK
ncbi:MAG: DUF4175 family protein [Sphingobacteriaceae bacterium]